jgi:hypothetical protein
MLGSFVGETLCSFVSVGEMLDSFVGELSTGKVSFCSVEGSVPELISALKVIETFISII